MMCRLLSFLRGEDEELLALREERRRAAVERARAEREHVDRAKALNRCLEDSEVRFDQVLKGAASND